MAALFIRRGLTVTFFAEVRPIPVRLFSADNCCSDSPTEGSSSRCRGGFNRGPEDFPIESSRKGLEQGPIFRLHEAFNRADHFRSMESGVRFCPVEELSSIRMRPMKELYNIPLLPGLSPPVSFNVAVSPSCLRRKDFKEWEDDAGLHIRLDMPGLGRENVKVQMEDGTLVIRGEPGEECEDGEVEKIEYNCLVDVPANVFKTEKIKIEMNAGVLKVLVPKITAEEERE